MFNKFTEIIFNFTEQFTATSSTVGSLDENETICCIEHLYFIPWFLSSFCDFFHFFIDKVIAEVKKNVFMTKY